MSSSLTTERLSTFSVLVSGERGREGWVKGEPDCVGCLFGPASHSTWPHPAVCIMSIKTLGVGSGLTDSSKPVLLLVARTRETNICVVAGSVGRTEDFIQWNRSQVLHALDLAEIHGCLMGANGLSQRF